MQQRERPTRVVEGRAPLDAEAVRRAHRPLPHVGEGFDQLGRPLGGRFDMHTRSFLPRRATFGDASILPDLRSATRFFKQTRRAYVGFAWNRRWIRVGFLQDLKDKTAVQTCYILVIGLLFRILLPLHLFCSSIQF